ncbi:MAG: homoserine dehydrogenase [Candidatus Dormibacteraeota bacterium]|nr:homoserine dehydrogenase [Candidatus Dormibacteraeota bacterium]
MTDTVGVGMLGLGTVGTAVARRLIREWELLGRRAGVMPVLRRIAVRDPSKARAIDLENVRLGGDPQEIVDDPAIAVVVEVMGGEEPARSLMERALRAGKTVVTANKLVVASHGPDLWSVAAAHSAGFYFEASVGAGLPIISLLCDSLRGDRVTSIDAIINGTTNVILTRMRRDGVTLQVALEDAQRRGYTEADPSADVDGWDAAQKLAIMSWLAFGVRTGIDGVDRVGIGAIDRVDLGYVGQLGYAVRLLAHADVDESAAVHVRVRPTAVPLGHALFDVDDSENAVLLQSDMAHTVLLRGLGAGGDSTASAVVSDIVRAVRQRGAHPAPPMADRVAPPDAGDAEVAGYLRLRIAGTSEAHELVLQALEDRGVVVVDAVDKPPVDGPLAQLLVLTGAAPRAVHERALETLDSLPVVHEIVSSLDRVEAEP